MGRHTSADEDVVAVPRTPELPARHRSVRHGRHVAAGDGDALDPDEQLTQVIAAVDPAIDLDTASDVAAAEDRRDTDEFPVPDEFERQALEQADQAAATSAGASAVAEAAEVLTSPVVKKQRSESGTRADLRLLRNNAAVRARCIAGVVAPFLLYTVVLVIIGGTNAYLVWIWIPIVLAGVLVGMFLDLAQQDVGRDGA